VDLLLLKRFGGLAGAVLAAALLLFRSALPASAGASERFAHVIVGGREATLDFPAVISGSDQVFAPVDSVCFFGASYKLQNGALQITSTLGKTFSAPLFGSKERPTISIIEVARQLGASAVWDSRSQTLELRAKLLMVKLDQGRLIIATSFPVEYATSSLDNPSRDYVDLFGVDLGSEAASIPVHSDSVSVIRTNQMDRSVARVALDLNGAPKMATMRGEKSAFIETPLEAPKPPPIVQLPTAPPALQAQSLKITQIQYVETPAVGSAIVITTTGSPLDVSPVTEWLDNPRRFAVDILGAEIALPASAGSILATGDSNVKSARWGVYSAHGQNYGRVVLDAQNKADYSVKTEASPDGTGRIYTIVIARPKAVGSLVLPAPTHSADSNHAAIFSGIVPVGTNHGFDPNGNPIQPIGAVSPTASAMAGVVVTIDPGHGGRDTGAIGNDGQREKDLTLKIATKVQADLMALGAVPLLTRTDDTFIDLYNRPQIAIDNKSAFFVSIHCDSSGAANSATGVTVYYHSNMAEPKALAACIAARLGSSGISLPVRGFRSDTALYSNGLAVLRLSPEPAVLVECGYINNDSDAAELADPATEESIAKAIAAGVADYTAAKSAKK
jgi:N-acetylmuramoyl-L-alanine amidase